MGHAYALAHLRFHVWEFLTPNERVTLALATEGRKGVVSSPIGELSAQLDRSTDDHVS